MEHNSRGSGVGECHVTCSSTVAGLAGAEGVGHIPFQCRRQPAGKFTKYSALLFGVSVYDTNTTNATPNPRPIRQSTTGRLAAVPLSRAQRAPTLSNKCRTLLGAGTMHDILP